MKVFTRRFPMGEHPDWRNLSVVDEPARLRFGGHTPYVFGGLVSPSKPSKEGTARVGRAEHRTAQSESRR